MQNVRLELKYLCNFTGEWIVKSSNFINKWTHDGTIHINQIYEISFRYVFDEFQIFSSVSVLACIRVSSNLQFLILIGAWRIFTESIFDVNITNYILRHSSTLNNSSLSHLYVQIKSHQLQHLETSHTSDRTHESHWRNADNSEHTKKAKHSLSTKQLQRKIC